jgi:hypothetical protein
MKQGTTQRGGTSRLRLWAITAVLAVVLAFPLIARADTISPDVDFVTTGPQDIINLGNVAPGAVITRYVEFTLVCSGKEHLDTNQYVELVVHDLTIPAGNLAAATTGYIGPVPASWPDDTSGGGSTNCGSPAETLTSATAQRSEVTITAPLAVGGPHDYVVTYRPSLTPTGNDDHKAVSGNPSVTFTLTVVASSNTAPVIAWTANPSTADEGQTKTYTFSITDPDADTWTFVSGPTCGTGGELGTSSIDNSLKTGTFQCFFPDGLAYTDVKVKVSDGTANSNELTQAVTVSNVAPTIGAVTPAAGHLVALGTAVNLSAAFSDPAGALDAPYKCTIDWDDGTTTTVNPATTPCAGSRTYAAAGVYSIKIDVEDKDGGVGTKTVSSMIIVYDPTAGFVTGGGWIESPAGAYVADGSLTGRATFGFVSKYLRGRNVPTGNTQFQLHFADFNFHSTSYEWLVVAGTDKAQYKGVGTVNGSGNYGFLLTVNDEGNSGDKFRIKIWDKDDSDAVVYDNKIGVSDDIDAADPQVIGGGSIVIHVPKK